MCCPGKGAILVVQEEFAQESAWENYKQGSGLTVCLLQKNMRQIDPAVVAWSVEFLLHKKCYLLAVDRIPLGETILATTMFYVY